MVSRHLQRWLTLLLALGVMLPAFPAQAEPLAWIGILQGSAVLVRQSTRYALAEGAALSEGDIVETTAGAFVQIEFNDGAIAGLGEASRLVLKPSLTGLKTAGTPRLYLLEGWMKVNLPPKTPAGFDVLSPQFELDAKEATVVVHVQPKAYALFTERGDARLLQRDGARETVALKAGDFAIQTSSANKPAVSARLSPEFVQQVPRLFRDSLPARAAVVSKRVVTLLPLGQVDYADVTAWLHGEPGVRLALSRQWRGRASDHAFRTEVATNLAAHMEWERVIYPERFLPKKPPPQPPPSRPVIAESAASEAASSPN